MKKNQLLALATFAICIVSIMSSCGAKDAPDKAILKIEAELGELEKYISITDEEVIIKRAFETKDNENYLDVSSSIALEVTKSVASDYPFGFAVEVLDEDHIIITDLHPYGIKDSGYSPNGSLSHILLAGKNRANMSINEKYDENKESDKKALEILEKVFSKGVYLIIKPYYENAKYAKYKEDVDKSNEDNESEASELDNLLDSYEEYVDKSIELAENMANGENISTDDYKDLMEQGIEISKKISKAQMDGTLSTSQLNRYNELTAKMAEASLELQKDFQ